MSLLTTQQLLKYRDTLQAISQISFSFTTLNRQFPMDSLTESEKEELIQAYVDLIEKTKKLVI